MNGNNVLTAPEEGPPVMFANAPPDRGGSARLKMLQDALDQVDAVLWSDNQMDPEEQLVFSAWIQKTMMLAKSKASEAMQPGPAAAPETASEYNPFSGPGGTPISGY